MSARASEQGNGTRDSPTNLARYIWSSVRHSYSYKWICDTVTTRQLPLPLPPFDRHLHNNFLLNILSPNTLSPLHIPPFVPRFSRTNKNNMANKPFFVIVPGASQNPAHYGYLSHLLQAAGYPVFSALLPSVGAAGKISAEDDTKYVRDSMLIPILDHEEHDIIIVMHSYSSVPGSAAAANLGKAERAAQGKKSGVIGQIYISALLPKGGDGKDVVGAFGGQYPPHIRPDVSYDSHGLPLHKTDVFCPADNEPTSLR